MQMLALSHAGGVHCLTEWTQGGVILKMPEKKDNFIDVDVNNNEWRK